MSEGQNNSPAFVAGGVFLFTLLFSTKANENYFRMSLQ